MGKTQTDPVPLPQSLTPFLAPLQAVQALLEAFGGQGVIIGGIATSLLGEPRFTADVDVVLLLELAEVPRLLQQAAARGLHPRIADVEAFARKNRVVLLRHTASGIDIDLSLGILPFEEEMVKRSRSLSVGGVSFQLPTPEDLIIMKAVAHRPKDMLDIGSVLTSHPVLDQEHIRTWVQQFAQALEMPELWDDLALLLK